MYSTNYVPGTLPGAEITKVKDTGPAHKGFTGEPNKR